MHGCRQQPPVAAHSPSCQWTKDAEQAQCAQGALQAPQMHVSPLHAKASGRPCRLRGHTGCATVRWVALSVKAQATASHNAMYKCRNALNNAAHTHSHARHALLKQQICQARALRHCYVAAQNSLCIHALTSVHTSRELFKLLSGWMGSNAPRGPASDCYRRCKHTRTHNTQT